MNNWKLFACFTNKLLSTKWKTFVFFFFNSNFIFHCLNFYFRISMTVVVEWKLKKKKFRLFVSHVVVCAHIQTTSQQLRGSFRVKRKKKNRGSKSIKCIVRFAVSANPLTKSESYWNWRGRGVGINNTCKPLLLNDGVQWRSFCTDWEKKIEGVLLLLVDYRALPAMPFMWFWVSQRLSSFSFGKVRWQRRVVDFAKDLLFNRQKTRLFGSFAFSLSSF